MEAALMSMVTATFKEQTDATTMAIDSSNREHIGEDNAVDDREVKRISTEKNGPI